MAGVDELSLAQHYFDQGLRSMRGRISHEFRTPLNAIIGFSEIIKDRLYSDTIEDKYVECAEGIHDSGDHLLRIVNDLIDLSRAEAGRFSVQINEVNIKDCIETACKLVTKNAADQNVLVKTVNGEATYRLNIDQQLTEHVLINLLSNAIKFSKPSTTVTLAVDRDNEGDVTVSVSDTGPGIEPELVERIGEPFLVERAQVNMPGRGAGLGLSISKRFVELMGGSLSVSSVMGQGTTAMLKFPSMLVVE